MQLMLLPELLNISYCSVRTRKMTYKMTKISLHPSPFAVLEIVLTISKGYNSFKQDYEKSPPCSKSFEVQNFRFFCSTSADKLF